MKLTVVGCAGSYPSPESPASCYLVEAEGAAIILDLGSGALGGLQRHIDLLHDSRLLGVVLSHCHIDHCADVGSLFVLRHYGPQRPAGPLRVLGPTVARQRIADIYGMPDLAELDAEFTFETLESTVRIGPFEISAIRALHPVEAYSLRITAGGRSLTYSGDTGPNPELVQLAQGTDIALFEASFVGEDNPVDLHMSGAEAAAAAQEAGAGLLVLTHQVAWNEDDAPVREASDHFSGPIEQAWPGMTITV